MAIKNYDSRSEVAAALKKQYVDWRAEVTSARALVDTAAELKVLDDMVTDPNDTFTEVQEEETNERLFGRP